MESTLSAAAASVRMCAISKTLNPSSTILISCLHRHFSTIRSTQCLPTRALSRRLRRAIGKGGFASIRSLSAIPIAPGGGSGGGGRVSGGHGGGGEGEAGAGDGKARVGVGGGEEGSTLSSDVIIFDVGGMTCGGCAASVKRILESQPLVSSASVNLTTETAIVWPTSEAKVVPNWKRQLGESLAKHLTTCGFNSTLRDSAEDNHLKFFERKIEEKRAQLKESGLEAIL